MTKFERTTCQKYPSLWKNDMITTIMVSIFKTVFLGMTIQALECQCRALTASPETGSYAPVFKAVESLVQFGDFDVILVTNDKTPGIFSFLSTSLATRVSLHTPEGTTDLNFYPFPIICNRTDSRLSTRPKLIFTMLKSPEEAKATLKGIANSITNCYNYIRGGYYVPENVIAHYLPGNDSLIQDLIFQDKESRRHGRVIALQSANGPYVKVLQYNVYESKVHSGIVSVSDIDSNFWKDWFQPFPMQGYSVRVVTMPYDIHVMGNIIPNKEDIRKSLHVTGGFEIDMLKLICQTLDCQLDFSNPADFAWGHAKNEPFGIVKDIVDEIADIALSAMGYYEYNMRVARNIGFLEFQLVSMATPKPKPSRSVLRLLHPFNTSVWIWALAAFFLTPLFLTKLSRVEETVEGNSLYWSQLQHSFWFVYAALIGENITMDMQYKNAWATRCLCLTWMMSSFILTAGYSGSLRGLLISPSEVPPVTTMAELVESDLTWKMVLYGEPTEKEWAASQDPVVKKFWERKTVVEYSPFPYRIMKQIYEGDTALVEYAAFLESLMEAGFTLPNGERLINVFPINHSTGSTITWLSHPLNPFGDRFSDQFFSIIESGVFMHIKRDTKYEMKTMHLSMVKAMNETTPAEDLVKSPGDAEDSGAREMKMKDFANVFWVYFSCCGLLSILFYLEILNSKRSGRSTKLNIGGGNNNNDRFDMIESRFKYALE